MFLAGVVAVCWLGCAGSPATPEAVAAGSSTSGLLAEAEERGVRVSEEEKRLPPSRLAHVIFSKVIPGLPP